MMVEGYWLYECNPIDVWDGWAFISPGREPEVVRTLLWNHTNWEGDGIWFSTALPHPSDHTSVKAYAVKQTNNGTTFVASPLELVWLRPLAAHRGYQHKNRPENRRPKFRTEEQ